MACGCWCSSPYPCLASSLLARPPLAQVHQRTGEGPEEIAARKRQAAWGAWLDVPFDPVAAAAAAAGSDAEGEEAAAEPAAAAAAVQLEQRRQGAAVPAGAGAAVLVYRALRWHLLSAAFCAAAKVCARAAVLVWCLWW